MNQPQSGLAAQLLATVGIDRVIWIDDDFSQNQPDVLATQFRTLIILASENRVVMADARLNKLNADIPDEIRSELAEAAIIAIGDDLAGVVDDLRKQVIAVVPSALSDPDELSPLQVRSLLTAFGTVEPFSFTKWEKEKTSALQRCNNKTLILVDREAKKENLGDTLGDEILAELGGIPGFSATRVMLTQAVDIGGVETLRKTIADKSNGKIKPHDFSVMSKKSISSGVESAEREFCRAACAVFTRRSCHNLATSCADVMKGALENAVADLLALSVDDLDKAIFESSLTEGGLEFDVIDRILSLRQREAVRKSVAGQSAAIEEVQRLRDLRALDITVGRLDPNENSRQSLREWRRLEVISSDIYINQTHSAISCGDVFKKDKGKMFVVLRQPCDLMARPNQERTKAHRNAKEVIWAEVRESDGTKKKPGPAQFVLEGAGEIGRDWIVDFRRTAFVDLSVLDFAAFSATGEVSLSLMQKPSAFFVPGLQLLFSEAQSKLALLKEKWPEKRPLSLSPDIPSAVGLWEAASSTVKFPYRRIGRINQPWAQAVLASFAAYHTRIALDHNFAGRLGQGDEAGDE